MSFVQNIADVLIFYFLDIWNHFLFSLKPSITQNNLVDYAFINRSETLIFLSLWNTPQFGNSY